VLFGFYIGFVGTPLIFGWLVDTLGDYPVAWLVVAGLFGLAAVTVGAWRDRAPTELRTA
jgi:cyanate permease